MSTVQNNRCLQRNLPMIKAKRVQIPVFHGMKDLQLQGTVGSIIKGKTDSKNNTQDEEELLPNN